MSEYLFIGTDGKLRLSLEGMHKLMDLLAKAELLIRKQVIKELITDHAKGTSTGRLIERIRVEERVKVLKVLEEERKG